MRSGAANSTGRRPERSSAVSGPAAITALSGCSIKARGKALKNADLAAFAGCAPSHGYVPFLR